MYHYTKSKSCISVGCPEATRRLRQKDREQKGEGNHIEMQKQERKTKGGI
jgi:hypothetical protein